MRFEGFGKQEVVQRGLVGFWKRAIGILQTWQFFSDECFKQRKRPAKQMSIFCNLSVK